MTVLDPGPSATDIEISTAELHDRLHDPDLTTVDVRPMAAYNGWLLNGEDSRGPHPGRGCIPVRLA